MEVAEIKRALAEHAEDVCRLLLPNGRLVKHDWCVGSLAGEAGDSLKICVSGDKAGIWTDFAGGGGGNNLLQLWMDAKQVAFKSALDDAKAWLEARGVRGVEARVQAPAKRRVYAKPSTAGITHINDAAMSYLMSERGIPLEVIQRYKVAGSEDGESIVFGYLHHDAPHLAQMIKGIKMARDERGKKVVWTSKDTAKVLFGKHVRRPGDRYLMITEGEIDTLSWASLGIEGLCVNSIPFGAKWEGKDGNDPNSEWIENDWEYLHTFERIYLSLDMDEEGQKATASILKRLGLDLCWIVKIPQPHKDGNEALVAGAAEEMRKAFADAKTQDPELLRNTGEFEKEVLELMFSGSEEERQGLALPFGNHPFRLRWNEWSLLSGINSSGKSIFLSYLMTFLRRIGHKSCYASFEVAPPVSISRMVHQCVGTDKPTKEKATEAIRWLAEGIWWYNQVGTGSIDQVLPTFAYAYRRYGCRFFAIDSLMRLGIDDDDFSAQKELCQKISEFCAKFPVHIFLVAHPRKQGDENQQMSKLDVRGSAILTDEAFNVMIVWRNVAKEREIEIACKGNRPEGEIASLRRAKPDTQIMIGKQRNGNGERPTMDLWFHKESKQYFQFHSTEGVDFTKPATSAPVVYTESVPIQTEAEFPDDLPF